MNYLLPRLEQATVPQRNHPYFVVYPPLTKMVWPVFQKANPRHYIFNTGKTGFTYWGQRCGCFVVCHRILTLGSI